MLGQIFHLKRRLIDFRRSASGMRDVANAIIRREEGLVGDDLDPYFRDVYDHLVRAVELVETQRDLLTGSLDIYLSAVANRTNEVMKVLTIYGTLAVPLVVITGFFGMNLHLPWSNNPHGVWYASALMASVERGSAPLFQAEAVVLKIGRLWQTAPGRSDKELRRSGFSDRNLPNFLINMILFREVQGFLSAPCAGIRRQNSNTGMDARSVRGRVSDPGETVCF